MRTVVARLMIAAACTVCLEWLGAFADVALAQTPGTQPVPTTPGTDPGTPPPTTDPGTTPPPPTTPPGSTPPPDTPPPDGGAGPGGTPSQPTVLSVLALLQAFFDAVQEFVVDEFPDASPEFQAWVTMALMDYLFGDLFLEFMFGAPPGSGSGGR
jgi:hypothetical protein